MDSLPPEYPSAAGLAGAAVGGAISYLVSFQQIREARAQRREDEGSDQACRSLERRFAAYADFLTHARRFRNAIRPPQRPGAGLRVPLPEIDALARSADPAGSVVFLVAESTRTEAACGTVMRTIGRIVGAIHECETDPDGLRWDELNEEMEQALREFQAATRAELGIHTGPGAAGRPTSIEPDVADTLGLFGSASGKCSRTAEYLLTRRTLNVTGETRSSDLTDTTKGLIRHPSEQLDDIVAVKRLSGPVVGAFQAGQVRSYQVTQA